MAKPYAQEIMKLADTFRWAMNADIAPLRSAIRTAGMYSLRAIGSGGSLTVAHAIVSFHQAATQHIAAVATPLESISEPLEDRFSTWLFSAGGSNVDILMAANSIIGREPKQMAVLCGRDDSPLAELCRRHPFVELLMYPSPAGKDGFLATNSLLGFASLLARAYAEEFMSGQWPDIAKAVEQLLNSAKISNAWKSRTSVLWERPTTVVLHGPSTRIGAVDLESKFTEAALGNIQVADYRNFAHGRHHWLAKRGDVSSILALISDGDRHLAQRTLDLIPSKIPQAHIEIAGSPYAAALGSLIAALKITEWAGQSRGIDPGRPGVPQFGRRLYRLPVPKRARKPDSPSLSDRDAAAISRKAGIPAHRLATSGGLARWRASLNSFRNHLCEATFAAVTLDYDGTVVDTRHRYELACDDIADQLSRLLQGGVLLAIATGRGVSARRDLRAKIPTNLWPRVLVGYYNGAEVSGLDDDATPDGSGTTCEALAPLAAALRVHPELAEATSQTDRRFQITLEAKAAMAENRLWDIAQQVVRATNTNGVGVTRSSHSIDIVAPGISKRAVLDRLRAQIGDGPILTIGDRGRWPGNDYELLQGRFALSVDETSVDSESCWNLASPGQRGVAATLEYLQALRSRKGGVRFGPKALR